MEEKSGKREYKEPEADIFILSTRDVITSSTGLSYSESGPGDSDDWING